ncbi:MAG TPA: YbjN domain-containing protein [Allosphingosinicella sp.]|nr:YbjN domain-containing protein [Allosphingosinicella sp.]
MNKFMLATLALAAAAPAPAPAAAAQVTAGDPAAVRALVERWGYRPGPLETSSGGVPNFVATIDEIATAVAFGGCTGGRNCTYVVFVSTYDDVVNPPWEWLNARNNDYDLVAVSRAETGHLSIRGGAMLGTQGIAEALFHDLLRDWASTNHSIAQEALDAHLATPETATAGRSIAPSAARR